MLVLNKHSNHICYTAQRISLSSLRLFYTQYSEILYIHVYIAQVHDELTLTITSATKRCIRAYHACMCVCLNFCDRGSKFWLSELDLNSITHCILSQAHSHSHSGIRSRTHSHPSPSSSISLLCMEISVECKLLLETERNRAIEWKENRNTK